MTYNPPSESGDDQPFGGLAEDAAPPPVTGEPGLSGAVTSAEPTVGAYPYQPTAAVPSSNADVPAAPMLDVALPEVPVPDNASAAPVDQPGIAPVDQPGIAPVDQPGIAPVDQPGTAPVAQPGTAPDRTRVISEYVPAPVGSPADDQPTEVYAAVPPFTVAATGPDELQTTAIAVDSAESVTVRGPRWWNRRRRNDLLGYVAAALGAFAAAFWSMQLWRADLRIPFGYTGDAVSSAAHLKATMQWGWYEFQNDLGAPFGQRYHEYPFGDHLPLVFGKVAGWFTDSWPVVFNLYYLLGFPLAGLTAFWFLRRCGVPRLLGVPLAVLFAVAPYHWMRGESHYYLAGYWPIPIIVWASLQVLRGRAVWGRRRFPAGSSSWLRLSGWFTGTGALAFIGLIVAASSTSYYAVFGALLIAAGGLVSLIRTRSWGRFLGAVAAAAVLGATVIANILPDVLYQRALGGNPAGLQRNIQDAEVYALKITSLIMPAPGHRIPFLAHIRNVYDSVYPVPSEQPALGLVGAIGLAIALAAAFYLIVRGLRPAGREHQPAPSGPVGSMVAALSGLTLLMVVLSTVGGLGTILAFLSPSLRGWNRMSILIALPCLALVGLLLHRCCRGVRRVFKHRFAEIAARVLIAAVVGAVGVYDQATGYAIPHYEEVAVAWTSDAAFVDALEATAGADASLFQAPFIAFPEGGLSNGAFDSDVVKLSLHSTTLHWSGGGVRGRPQTDWPLPVSQAPAAVMVEMVAEMGFAGIVVDVVATGDGGAALLGGLTDELGPQTLVSNDGRWHYFALTDVIAGVDARTTPDERAQFVSEMLSDPNGTVARYTG